MPKSQKLSPQEISTQLFDELMEQIEPKLTTGTRTETARELAAMKPDERKERLSEYQRAYEKFMERWPSFIASAIGEMKNMGDAFVEISRESDASKIQSIEKKFRDDSSAVA